MFGLWSELTCLISHFHCSAVILFNLNWTSLTFLCLNLSICVGLRISLWNIEHPPWLSTYKTKRLTLTLTSFPTVTFNIIFLNGALHDFFFLFQCNLENIVNLLSVALSIILVLTLFLFLECLLPKA